MDREQILAFRVARHGLAARRPLTPAQAAACPASDFVLGSALLALAARADDVTREAYDSATDSGELVIAPTLRAAIHAVAPADFALWGRALLAEEDAELGVQLGPAAQRLLETERIAPRQALEEVAAATAAALGGGRALTKDELHAELRERVRAALLPWCKGCGSHHVSPMLWRFAGVAAGMRCDSRRRFLLGRPGPRPDAAEAPRRFLRAYGPATRRDFGAWAGLARAHATALWSRVEDDLAEVRVDGRRAYVLREDEPELESPPPPAVCACCPRATHTSSSPTGPRSPPTRSSESGSSAPWPTPARCSTTVG